MWTQPNFTGNGAEILFSISQGGSPYTVTQQGFTPSIAFSFFLVPNGTVFDPTYIQGNTPVVSYSGALTSIYTSQDFQISENTPFYLAFLQDVGGSGGGPSPGDGYGWAELNYTSAVGLTLLGNAISGGSGSDGIIVGTQTALTVPEPSTGMLMALCAWLFLCLRGSRALLCRFPR